MPTRCTGQGRLPTTRQSQSQRLNMVKAHTGLVLAGKCLTPHSYSAAQVLSVSSVHYSLEPQSAPIYPLHPAQALREECTQR